MVEPQNGQYFGRLFSYPQGIGSFFAAVLTVAAVIANFWPLWGRRVGNDSIVHRPYFVCWQVEVSGQSYYNEFEDSNVWQHDASGSSVTFSPNYIYNRILRYYCDSLYITNVRYWDEKDDDMQMAQAAALMVVVSFLGGALTFFHLLSASCFELSPRKLLLIAVTQIVCAVCVFVSIFIASIVDPCKNIDGYCDRVNVTGMRLQEGSVAVLFATFFYMWAAVMVLLFRKAVKQQQDRARNTQINERSVNQGPPQDDNQNQGNICDNNHKIAEETKLLVDEETATSGADHHDVHDAGSPV